MQEIFENYRFYHKGKRDHQGIHPRPSTIEIEGLMGSFESMLNKYKSILSDLYKDQYKVEELRNDD